MFLGDAMDDQFKYSRQLLEAISNRNRALLYGSELFSQNNKLIQFFYEYISSFDYSVKEFDFIKYYPDWSLSKDAEIYTHYLFVENKQFPISFNVNNIYALSRGKSTVPITSFDLQYLEVSDEIGLINPHRFNHPGIVVSFNAFNKDNQFKTNLLIDGNHRYRNVSSSLSVIYLDYLDLVPVCFKSLDDWFIYQIHEIIFNAGFYSGNEFQEYLKSIRNHLDQSLTPFFC